MTKHFEVSVTADDQGEIKMSMKVSAESQEVEIRPQVGWVDGLCFMPGRDGARQVPPEDPSPRIEHAVHLSSDVGTQIARRDAAETDELRHQVEVSRRKRYRQAAAAAKADVGVHGLRLPHRADTIGLSPALSRNRAFRRKAAPGSR